MGITLKNRINYKQRKQMTQYTYVQAEATFFFPQIASLISDVLTQLFSPKFPSVHVNICTSYCCGSEPRPLYSTCPGVLWQDTEASRLLGRSVFPHLSCHTQDKSPINQHKTLERVKAQILIMEVIVIYIKCSYIRIYTIVCECCRDYTSHCNYTDNWKNKIFFIVVIVQKG